MAKKNANLGRDLEEKIIRTNAIYLHKRWGVVQKVPTSWVVIRKGPKIVRAFPEQKSTIDFMGVANGRALAFEAKSTQERSRFPLANIEEHQISFLQYWKDQGGIAFFLIEFVKLGEVYYCPYDWVLKYWEEAAAGGRKSIPYLDFTLECDQVTGDRDIELHYLSHVKKEKES